MVVGCGSLAMPRIVQWVEDGPLGGQRGRLWAARGVSRALCQQLPWFLVALLTAGGGDGRKVPVGCVTL